MKQYSLISPLIAIGIGKVVNKPITACSTKSEIPLYIYGESEEGESGMTITINHAVAIKLIMHNKIEITILFLAKLSPIGNITTPRNTPKKAPTITA